MGAAEELFEKSAKLIKRVSKEVEYVGFDVRDASFSFQPGEDKPVLRLALVYDPDKETQPKVEIVQLEGQVSQGLDDAWRAEQERKAEEARRKLSEYIKEEGLNGRGGFLRDDGDV